MRIGDKVEIVKPDFAGHQAGMVGFIVKVYWFDEDETMYGVSFEPDNLDGDYPYSSKEIILHREQSDDPVEKALHHLRKARAYLNIIDGESGYALGDSVNELIEALEHQE